MSSFLTTSTRIRESPTWRRRRQRSRRPPQPGREGHRKAAGSYHSSCNVPLSLKISFFGILSIYRFLIQGANATKGLTAKVRLVHISLFVCSAHNHNLTFTTNRNHNLAFTDGQQ